MKNTIQKIFWIFFIILIGLNLLILNQLHFKLKLSIYRNYKYKHAISSNIIPPIENLKKDDFEDTYGAPRPGGRKHQGIDLLCDYGTELLSVIDGSNQEPLNIFLIEKNR
jgi:hypothetical protein